MHAVLSVIGILAAVAGYVLWLKGARRHGSYGPSSPLRVVAVFVLAVAALFLWAAS